MSIIRRKNIKKENKDNIDNENPEQKPKKKFRIPKNTAFNQQRLRAWQPILTPKQVLPTLFLIGMIFAPIGAILLSYSNKVHDWSLDYTECEDLTPNGDFEDMPVSKYDYPTFESYSRPTWQYFTDGNSADPSTTAGCRIRFNVPSDLETPVFLYYKLNRYYQNHRRYIKSFDQEQLQGKYRTPKQLDGADCKPLGSDNGSPIYPCGLIANSLFNDTIMLPVQLDDQGSNLRTYNMTDKGISWKHEGDKYKSPDAPPQGSPTYVPPPNWRERYPNGYTDDQPLPDLSQDEHFQVWMRPAAFPDFLKLYYRNDDEVMTSGLYEIVVYMNYPVRQFNGRKSIVFSTVTSLGGRNSFLGIAYIALAAFFVLIGLFFTIIQLIKPRRVGDFTLLSWNQPKPHSN